MACFILDIPYGPMSCGSPKAGEISAATREPTCMSTLQQYGLRYLALKWQEAKNESFSSRGHDYGTSYIVEMCFLNRL